MPNLYWEWCHFCLGIPQLFYVELRGLSWLSTESSLFSQAIFNSYRDKFNILKQLFLYNWDPFVEDCGWCILGVRWVQRGRVGSVLVWLSMLTWGLMRCRMYVWRHNLHRESCVLGFTVLWINNVSPTRHRRRHGSPLDITPSTHTRTHKHPPTHPHPHPHTHPHT